jgi:hypothetical protein
MYHHVPDELGTGTNNSGSTLGRGGAAAPVGIAHVPLLLLGRKSELQQQTWTPWRLSGWLWSTEVEQTQVGLYLLPF